MIFSTLLATAAEDVSRKNIGEIFAGFFSLLIEDYIEVLKQTAIHMQMTIIAVVASTVIGLAIALIVWDKPRAKLVAMNLCTTFMVIPSIALLAFMLPFFGLGILPTIVALILYALVPIVQNGITSLSDTSAELMDAGEALGMNRWEKLFYIQLPQGLPVLVSGLRVAFILAIGTATLGAFIAAGGLGSFIITGLARQNYSLILVGAIPAAVLAILIDYLLAFVEKGAVRWKNGFPIFQTMGDSISVGVLSTILLGTTLAGSFILLVESRRSDKPVITVGGKAFAEQDILAETIALCLEATGEFEVDKKLTLSGSLLAHQATMTGDIDCYIEYSGTAIQNTLKIEGPGSREATQALLEREYPKRFGIEWLKPLGFENGYTLIVRKDGPAHETRTISDMVPLADRLQVGMTAEFYDRPDGYPLFQDTYGLDFRGVKSMETGYLYSSIDAKLVEAIVGFSTDGQLASGKYITLQDDQLALPIYDAAPVLNANTARKYPLVREVLLKLAGKFPQEVMQRLNAEVQMKQLRPRDVARNFYEAHLREEIQALTRQARERRASAE